MPRRIASCGWHRTVPRECSGQWRDSARTPGLAGITAGSGRQHLFHRDATGTGSGASISRRLSSPSPRPWGAVPILAALLRGRTERSGSPRSRTTRSDGSRPPWRSPTSFPVSGNNLCDITAGPDGNLWFTESTFAGAIGRITTSGSRDRPMRRRQDSPRGSSRDRMATSGSPPAADPGAIGRITTSGTITLFTSGLTTNAAPLDIVAGADGNLYFTENAGAGRIGQITTLGRDHRIHCRPDRRLRAMGHRERPDGNIWFTENAGNRVGQAQLRPWRHDGSGDAIHASDATLAGTVTPRSQATTYSFDWGLTTGVRLEHDDVERRQRRIRAAGDRRHQRARSRHDLPLPRGRDQRRRHNAGRGSHVHDPCGCSRAGALHVAGDATAA